MKTAEKKFGIPKSCEVNEEVMSEGSSVLIAKPSVACAKDTTYNLREGIFKKVLASQLSLRDDFLKYFPKTLQEKTFKKEVKKVIKAGVTDFWRPVCDPSFDDNGCICYEPGSMPGTNQSYNWWAKNAKDFCPERGSRLGTKSEYIAFMAVLIKDLVASGKSLKWAWNAVCNDSKELGHFVNSKEAKDNMEPTGSREICGWCDLGNTCKIMSGDGEYSDVWMAKYNNSEELFGDVWMSGGNFLSHISMYSLADLRNIYLRNVICCCSCGWVVLTKGSDDNR